MKEPEPDIGYSEESPEKRVLSTVSKPNRDHDYYAWLVEHTRALRVRQPDFIDWAGLAEELEEMAQRTKDSLTSHLAHVLEHLLKLRYEPSARDRAWRERGWKKDIAVHRDEIKDILDGSPSLRNQIKDFIAKAYPRGCRYAGTVMVHLDSWQDTFPAECPWSVEEILDNDFFPAFSNDSNQQSH
jgi:Domain of unknown function DUF29